MENLIVGIVLLIFGIISVVSSFYGKNIGGSIPAYQTYFLRKSKDKEGLNILNFVWAIISIFAGLIIIGKSLH
jgi:hypothetical protein